MPPHPTPDLRGFTVGVTADRRGDDQEVLLRRLGVEVLRGPVLRAEQAPVDDELRRVTEALIARPPDYLVANTGFGMRAWWERAGEWGLAEPLTTALSHSRIAVRGPKAYGAVRSAGLTVWWRSPVEQLDSVAERLLEEDLAGATVAVQRHGEDHPIAGRLRGAGATVVEVPVYRGAPPGDRTAALRLVERTVAGGVDALTFTSAPAVRGFAELARATGAAEGLLAAVSGPLAVVCIGPVCAAAAVEQGWPDPMVPEHWRLGAMVALVGRVLGERRGGQGPGGDARGTTVQRFAADGVLPLP